MLIFQETCQNIIGRNATDDEIPRFRAAIHVLYCHQQFAQTGEMDYAVDAWRTLRSLEMDIPEWLLGAFDKLAMGNFRRKRRAGVDNRIFDLVSAVSLKAQNPEITQARAAKKIGIDPVQLNRNFRDNPEIPNPFKRPGKA
jgi:hypothetical protein